MATDIGELRARLTAEATQIKAELRQVKQYLKEQGDEAKAAAGNFDSLNNALSQVGLGANQIKKINTEIRNTNPQILEKQLEQVRNQLRLLGVDAKQIEKIEQEMKEASTETANTKRSVDGLASGLAALGAGAATAKLAMTFKSLADEAQRLAMSYQGLIEVSKALNVGQEESVGLAEELSDRWGISRTALADTVKTYLTAGLTLEQTKDIITATADAAVYNREAHLSWDEAIRQVAQGIKMGNSELTDAAGITTNLSVMYDRFAKSIGTTAAKLTESQKIQAAYNGIMQESAIFAGNADSAMTGYTGTQATFAQTMQMARVELGEAFLPVLQEIMETVTPMIKEFADWAAENEDVIAGIAAATITLGGLITVVTSLITVVAALRAAFTALNISMGPIGWAIAAFSAVTIGVTAYSAAASAASKEVLQLASSQEELNKKLNESPANRDVATLKKMQEDSKALNEILEERAQLQERLNEVQKKMRSNFDGGAELHNLQRAIGELDTALKKDMKFDSVDDATAALKRMREEIDKSVPALLEMQKAELRDLSAKNDKIIALEKSVDRYNKLAAVQKIEEAQKQELVQITNALKEQYPDLHALMDDEGRIRIENIDTIEDQINVERQLLDSSINTAKTQIFNLQETARVQKESVEAQIKNYQALIQAAKAVTAAQSPSNPMEAGEKSWLEQVKPGVVNWVRNKGASTEGQLSQAYENQNKFAAAELEAKRALARLESGGIDSFKYESPDYGGGSDGGKNGQKNKTAAELRKDAYDAAIATVQYQAEMYDWTAEKQIEAYEKVRKQHKQHLAESIEDERQMNLQIKRLQEDSVRSRYDFSAEWIDREERRMEESGKTEIEIAQMKIDAWTRVRDRYAKDSEQYKQADEELYRARKDLINLQEQAEKEASKAREERIKDFEKQNDELLNSELKAIDKAKKAELDAIDQRKKEYIDAQDEKIAAIDALLKKEEELNSDVDYDTQLAEKKARQALLSTAVSPEGRKELADITAEIERMQLEHSRELRKRDLEDQKDKLEEEKDDKEDAYDEEKRLTEARYDALTDALQEHQDDIEFIESAIKNFRIGANQEANTQILSDLDLFVSEYRSRMSEIASLSAVTGSGGTGSAGPSSSQASLDLAEYNANKDAWDAAKARGDKEEMARLTARNEEIRKLYGIDKDTGKLPSFDVGGVVPGPLGAPMQAVIHGGEMIFNPEQFENMFRRLTAPVTSSAAVPSAAPIQHIENRFDMSVGVVHVEDQTDAEILYTEREKAARRLATTGGGK